LFFTSVIKLECHFIRNCHAIASKDSSSVSSFTLAAFKHWNFSRAGGITDQYIFNPGSIIWYSRPLIAVCNKLSGALFESQLTTSWQLAHGISGFADYAIGCLRTERGFVSA